MPRANEIKKGMVLNYNGKLLIVKNIDIQSPSARGAATLYKMRFSDVRTGLKVEERFKGDDIVDTVTLTRRFVDFSYVDGNEYVFMDKAAVYSGRRDAGYAGADLGRPAAGPGAAADR